MAKQKTRRKKPQVNPADRAQAKKFFTITAVIVVLLLILIYWVTS